MQPSPTAETSGPPVPSLRFCIALQYRFPSRTTTPMQTSTWCSLVGVPPAENFQRQFAAG